MPLQLTWDDLLIQNIGEPDTRTWLGYWSDRVNGNIAPVFMSKFGDWFLRRPNGSTDKLSVIEGTDSTIATTPEELSALVNTPPWQEEDLLSLQVRQLHDRGMIPNQGQCYAFAPHPVWSGRIDVEHVLAMDIGVWQHICAETFNQQKPSGKE